MAEGTKTIKATCLCGSAAHEITLPVSDFPLKCYMCHCDSCRHMTGTLCLTVVFLTPDYTPSQDLLDKLTPFVFSRRITQYHCKTCGTQMVARCLDDPDKAEPEVTWDAATGTLEHFDDIMDVQGHEQVADTLDGGFADLLATVNEKPLERWAHHFRKGDQLPLYWRTPKTQLDKPPTQDKLHAYCKCKGVQMWIARPSAQSEKATAGQHWPEPSWPDVLVPHNSGPVSLPENELWWLRANRKKFLGGLCTCNSCRLAAGMECVEWAFVPTADITLDAEGKVPFSLPFGSLKSYRSSSKATRYFCGTCGAMVFWHGDERPGLIDVAAGLLAAPEGARAESWLEWRTERLSYREDAVDRAGSLVRGIEAGLNGYGKKIQGDARPHEEVAKYIDTTKD